MTHFTIKINQVLSSVDGTKQMKTTDRIATAGEASDVCQFIVDINGTKWLVNESNILSYQRSKDPRWFTMVTEKNGERNSQTFSALKEIYDACEVAKSNGFKVVSMVNKSGNSI